MADIDAPPRPVAGDLRYWLQGEGEQNFGDFLSEFLLRHLFYPQPSQGRDLRLIGSCIDDWFVEPPTPSRRGPIFWGCGLRREDGLSPERRGTAEILAVRGPLTRAALRLDPAVPVGDPALLLPALHRPGLRARRGRGTDRAALPRPPQRCRIAGTERLQRGAAAQHAERSHRARGVHRPHRRSRLRAVRGDARGDRGGGLWAEIRVLGQRRSGSAVQVADFAASIEVPCEFHRHLVPARAQYDTAIAPPIRIPPLWPLLAAAPLPVRPDAFLRVVAMDVARHGPAVLGPVSSRGANSLAVLLAQATEAAEATLRLRADLREREAEERDLRERLAIMTERAAREAARRQDESAQVERREVQFTETALRAARLQAAHEQLLAAQAAARVQTARLQGDVARLNLREATLAAEEARLHEAVQARNHALAAARGEADAHLAELATIRTSITWRLAAPLRIAGRRMPWAVTGLRRTARLVRLAATLQLGRHLARRRLVRGQVALLRQSPLFDAGYYLAQHPEVAAAGADPAAHYVFTGAALGCEPCRLFDSRWYAATYADCRGSGLSPLAHYLTEGAAAGLDPHPLFDTAWYAARHGVGGAAALLHYLREGGAPNALFDPAGYLAEYRDARACGLDPVRHFLEQGAAAGHHPHPLFDTAWYVATYPEVATSGMNPLAHYLRIGAAQGYDCTPLQRRIAGFRLDRTLAFTERDDPEASIVIPVYGRSFDTLRCLHCLAAHSEGTGYEVIILDDDPSNPAAPFLANIPGLRIHVNPTNLGFLRSCNQAMTLARGWHIVFLNNDTWPGVDWLEPLVRTARRDPKVGMVGCKLLNADGTIQEAGGIILRSGWGASFGRGDEADRPEYNYRREVDVVTGAAFLVRRELFVSLGGFDERYAPAYYEEFDLAFKARRAGFTVQYQPRSEVTHLGSASYGSEMRDRQSLRNHGKFRARWAAELAHQPADEAEPFLARQRPGACGIILMIDDKVPEYDRHAGALTIFQYVKLLRGLGLRIVYCPADLVARQPYAAVLQELGVEVLYRPADPADWLAANGRYLTAVWTARPVVTAGLLDLIRATTSARILYYPHDLHYLRERRRYELEGDGEALEASERFRALELAIFREVDCVMTPSSEEAKVIRQEVPEAKIRVIPPYLYPAQSADGIDAASFAARHDILFVGGFKHSPNVDAALWLAREIMPLIWPGAPDTKLILVGDDPTEDVQALSTDARIEVTGYAPDLAPYFARARVSACPVRYGAGVKGKIVGSLQAGIPVVTTAVGNEGIALADGREVLLGETAAELADALLRLMLDPALCALLSTAGIGVINQRFSEDLAREVMLEVLDMKESKQSFFEKKDQKTFTQ